MWEEADECVYFLSFFALNTKARKKVQGESKILKKENF